MGLRRWPYRLVGPVPWHFYAHSRLCIRCRDQGFILPADPASVDSCRGHLAEDRINQLIIDRALDV
jgi:hypothetical protein